MNRLAPNSGVARAYREQVKPAVLLTDGHLTRLNGMLHTAITQLVDADFGRRVVSGNHVTQFVPTQVTLAFPRMIVRGLTAETWGMPDASDWSNYLTVTANHMASRPGESYIFDAGSTALCDAMPASSLQVHDDKMFTVGGIGSVYEDEIGLSEYTTADALTGDYARAYLNRLIIGTDLGRMVLGVADHMGYPQPVDPEAMAMEAVGAWQTLRPDIYETVWQPYYLERVAALAGT